MKTNKRLTTGQIVEAYRLLTSGKTVSEALSIMEMDPRSTAFHSLKKTVDLYLARPKQRFESHSYRRAARIVAKEQHDFLAAPREKQEAIPANGTGSAFDTAIMTLDQALEHLKKSIERVIVASVEERLKTEGERLKLQAKEEALAQLRTIAKKENWATMLRTKIIGG